MDRDLAHLPCGWEYPVEQTEIRSDPTADNQTYSSHECSDTSILVGSSPEENNKNAIESNSDKDHPQHEPTPPEALMRIWDSVKNHSTEIVALSTAGTFLATLAYAVFASGQWASISRQTDIMQESSRPYIGIFDVKRTDIQPGSDGASFIVSLKNFGERPAFQFEKKMALIIDGIEQVPKTEVGPETAFTFYPGVLQYMRVNIPESKWSNVEAGKKLQIRVKSTYQWPDSANGVSYQDCEVRRYEANGTFPIDGGCH